VAVSDFLFNGSPPASTTTYGSTTANLPAWYNDFVQGIAAKGNAIAAEPFQAYGAPRIADFNADQTAGFQTVRDAQGAFQPTVQNGVNALQGAVGQSGLSAANPFFQDASSLSATGAAQPYANQAGQTFTGSNVSQYMSPYIQNVVDRAGTLAARQLNEKLMPAINQDFIRAGQYGSTAMMDTVGKGLRDVNDSMTEQIGTLLNQGYTQAGQMFGQDAGRAATLANTMGSLTNTEQGNIAQMGQAAGNLQQAGITSTINAGTNLGTLATQGQNLAYKDAAGLSTIGEAQNAMDQKNLDLAYSDFQEQKNYPQTQLNNLSNLVRGFQQPTSTTTTTTSQQPGTQASSGLATISGGLATLLGSLKAKGGRIDAQQMRRSAARKINGGGLQYLRKAHG
jgi:hypothetical protein